MWCSCQWQCNFGESASEVCDGLCCDSIIFKDECSVVHPVLRAVNAGRGRHVRYLRWLKIVEFMVTIVFIEFIDLFQWLLNCPHSGIGTLWWWLVNLTMNDSMVIAREREKRLIWDTRGLWHRFDVSSPRGDVFPRVRSVLCSWWYSAQW